MERMVYGICLQGDIKPPLEHLTNYSQIKVASSLHVYNPVGCCFFTIHATSPAAEGRSQP